MKQQLMNAAFTITLLAHVGSVVAIASDGSKKGPNHFRIGVEGFQENPSNSTTGSGQLDLRIDDDRQIVEYVLSYENLEGVLVPSGEVLAAHIHFSAPSFNGGVVAFLCGGGGKPPCPSPEGVISGTIVATDIVGPAAQGINPGEAMAFEEFVRAIRAGYTYVNVHTTRWPGGEIRGQILRGHHQDH